MNETVAWGFTGEEGNSWDKKKSRWLVTRCLLWHTNKSFTLKKKKKKKALVIALFCGQDIYLNYFRQLKRVAQLVKKLPANARNAREAGSIPGLGRSPGIGNGSPLKYSCRKISWMEEPGRPLGLQRVRHDWEYHTCKKQVKFFLSLQGSCFYLKIILLPKVNILGWQIWLLHGERAQSFHTLCMHVTLPKSPCVHQAGSFPDPSFW